MKKYIIAIALFCLSLFLIEDVYAAQLSLTGYDSLINASLWNCSGSNTCSTSVSNSTNVYGDYLVYTSAEELTIGSNGVFWAIQSPVNFSDKYLYSFSALVCFENKAPNTFEILTGESGDLSKFNSPSYSKVYDNWSPNDYIYLSDGGYANLTLKTCRNVSGFINPSKIGNFLGLRLKNTSSTISAQYIWLLGLKVESVGVDSATVRSVLESSIASNGLATASSVEEVQQAQEEIKTEIQSMHEQQEQTNQKIDETNKQLEETNDYITSDEEPNSDISSLGNVQGLLPPGPVDSLLNIPFYFLSVVNSSMGGVCVPISSTFVFDSTLTLPCFGELFYDNVPAYLMNFISLIPAGWLLIKYFKHLYKKVNRAVSMESNADDEWGVL